MLIAISGKGGVGKTTIAALLITRLINHGKKPVLAIDADPNSCLDQLLGVKVTNSIGRVREEAKELASKNMSGGISKQDFMALKIAESLVEAKDFDLLAMGRPEGAGCYCYANNVMKDAIERLSSKYPYVVIDNEAGLENLSRRIVQKADLFVFVADPSQRGLDTLLRLYDLAAEMKIEYGKLAIVVNRLRKGTLPKSAYDIKERTHADYLFGLSDDGEIADLSESNGSLFTLSPENSVLKEIDQLLLKSME